MGYLYCRTKNNVLLAAVAHHRNILSCTVVEVADSTAGTNGASGASLPSQNAHETSPATPFALYCASSERERERPGERRATCTAERAPCIAYSRYGVRKSAVVIP